MICFSLGNAYFSAGDFDRALTHLAAALAHDPQYSATWKLYGRSLAECGRYAEALDAFDKGIEVADDRGDIQAAKEMRVFRRRAQKSLADS